MAVATLAGTAATTMAATENGTVAGIEAATGTRREAEAGIGTTATAEAGPVVEIKAKAAAKNKDGITATSLLRIVVGNDGASAESTGVMVVAITALTRAAATMIGTAATAAAKIATGIDAATASVGRPHRLKSALRAWCNAHRHARESRAAPTKARQSLNWTSRVACRLPVDSLPTLATQGKNASKFTSRTVLDPAANCRNHIGTG